MSGPLRSRPVAALLVPALLALAIASCAPPPHPGSALEGVAARWELARSSRAALLGALQADIVVRVDGRASGKLPALAATLAIAAPDRMRLRASAIIGVAFDLLVSRDSLWAWVPSERVAFRGAGDSLGLGQPAAFAARVLGATWAPPAGAWRAASAESTGWQVGWREGADTLSLRVDGEARPLAAWVGHDGIGVGVRYSDWTSVGGQPFPARWELADDTGWARVRIDLDDARTPAAADSGWFTPRRGAVRWLGWGDLREVLGHWKVR